MSGKVTDNLGRASGLVKAPSAGRTGTVDWDTSSIKTSTFTAESGNGYFCNTAGGTFEMDLPAGVAGSIVSVQDYNNTFDSNALSVDPDGSEVINGGAAGEPISLTTEGKGVTFVYVDATVGWRSVQDNEYATGGASYLTATGGTPCAGATCGDYKVHTFTGPGTFCVSAIGTAANNAVAYMVVAGGGGGGSSPTSNSGAGGGAGGFREGTTSPVVPYTASPLVAATGITVTASPYSIVVGGGGATSTSTSGTQGSTSSFSSISSAGGGYGGTGASPGPGAAGGDGGSGGGGGGGASGPDGHVGGSGDTPSTSPPQGNDGGGARPGPGPSWDSASGGGGGAGAAGGPSPNGCTGGAGGTKVNSSIDGSDTEYSGGAGGAGQPAAGGTPGGGGAGQAKGGSPSQCATAGGCNTGGSGGGAWGGSSGGAGGSGVVVIRYKFQ